jgi:predicted ribosome quality control (RQC) complex YloA/Tae2 family protein
VLTLPELRRAVTALDREARGARLVRARDAGPRGLALELAGGGASQPRERRRLVLSFHPRYARLGAAPGSAPAAAQAGGPSPWVRYLRAHLEGGRLEAVRLRGEERQASLRFATREGPRELLLSILGPRSNLYVLDGDERVLFAARPLAETRRDLSPGAVWRDPEGRPPSGGEDRFAGVAEADLLTAIERRYAALEAEEQESREDRRLLRALDRALASLDKKTARLAVDREAGVEAAALERQGELLKAHLAQVRTGDRQVEARDFESGESVTVPLDPALGPARNLEEIFRRARKAARRAAKAGQELAELTARRAELAALRVEAEALPDAEARTAFAERPEMARILARFAPAESPGAATAPAPPRKVFRLGKRELPARLAPKRYRTRDGLEIWVGKSDEGNDLLTTRLARGKDLFFHLEGWPGSHVVLRTEGREAPPQESLLEAAELAVHFSKQRDASRASVHVAPIKDVSKPSGAKPGLVYVHRGRTIALRRDPARLRRILEARIDE